MKRRTFLIATGSISISSSPLLMATEADPIEPRLKPAFIQSKQTIELDLTVQQWDTIAAAQEHLFPAEPDSPGASDVNAQDYLHAILADANREETDRQLIKQGAIKLDAIGQQQFNKPFVELNEFDRETSLRTFEQEGGRAWIMTLLGYIFEALLADPIYGGNPQTVGWQWLQHHPGFPRPQTRFHQL
ncbi:gluconate 2-dehydrogenase subunit 3 family protein [Candidatus Albibeggiatoa sp. nov. NOAA]|uniref:gluconate 2-dehydrogenase subunit 3 family protein n=1 Tax=Candidatus Albibeggiatoa sp. nov. NOAA TaxID=3162724 RepID=UPI0033005A28|nr:gluconate 2-dehydrogenase subunit 3 family protein [Thiotrichaceae bacterium]